MTTTVTAAQIVDEARTWDGTPFLHQAALKGVGCDCVGLIRGIAVELGLAFDRAAWKAFANYPRLPNPKRMADGLAAFMVSIEPADLSHGDVVFLEWREELPMHLGVYATDRGRATLVHALAEAGKVCEHGFNHPWPDRLSSCWRYRERVGGA